MKPTSKAFISLLLGLSFMCFAAIFTKSAEAPGLVTVFYRMGGATLILFPVFLFIQLRTKDTIPLKGIFLAAIAGVCFGFDMFFWSRGVVKTNATIPTLFANLAPIWVGFGAIVIFREKKRFGFWLGLLVAISGVFILVAKELSASSSMIEGMILGLFAGMFYAAFYLLSQPGRKILNTLNFLFISTLSSAIVLGILMLFSGYALFGYNTHTKFMFMGLSLGVQVIGWFLINYAQGFLSASLVAPTLLGQPILTGILAYLLLDERLTYLHIIGASVALLGIYMVHFFRTR